jgi:hypothetical protein
MRLIVTLGLLLILVGCGNARWTSIHREYKISESHDTQSALIDAKQRAILSSPIVKDDDGFDERAFIVCAEPSPDAVSALSSALSASLGVKVAEQGEGEGSLAFALSEAVGKLGKRNATIQLLRDGFYRQCEAYLNGIINPQEYQVTAGRYVDAMVTLLAIEQVTSPTAGEAPLIIRASTVSGETDVTGQSTQNGSPAPAAGPEAQGDKKPDDDKAPPAAEAASGDTPKTPNGGGGPASEKKSTKGTARADGGDVNVNLPGVKTGQVSKEVATEVRQMVNIFLVKDARDRCLDRIGKFADRYEYGNEPSTDEKILIDNFTTLCFDVIRSSVRIDLGGPPVEKDDGPEVEDGSRDPSQIRPRLLTPEES